MTEDHQGTLAKDVGDGAPAIQSERLEGTMVSLKPRDLCPGDEEPVGQEAGAEPGKRVEERRDEASRLKPGARDDIMSRGRHARELLGL